jgi:hypothetical protein
MNTETLNYLKSVILSQLLLETNESLSHTNRYRQDLKQQVNRTNKLIEPIVREEFDKIYESDPEMTTNILNKIESLVSKIGQYQLEELVILESVINKYADNKEWFLEHTASEFLRID